jgi:hypothetical protein
MPHSSALSDRDSPPVPRPRGVAPTRKVIGGDSLVWSCRDLGGISAGNSFQPEDVRAVPPDPLSTAMATLALGRPLPDSHRYRLAILPVPGCDSEHISPTVIRDNETVGILYARIRPRAPSWEGDRLGTRRPRWASAYALECPRTGQPS